MRISSIFEILHEIRKLGDRLKVIFGPCHNFWVMMTRKALNQVKKLIFWQRINQVLVGIVTYFFLRLMNRQEVGRRYGRLVPLLPVESLWLFQASRFLQRKECPDETTKALECSTSCYGAKTFLLFIRLAGHQSRIQRRKKWQASVNCANAFYSSLLTTSFLLLGYKKSLTDIGSRDVSRCVKVDADEFALKYEKSGLSIRFLSSKKVTYETWGVVILDSLCVAKCFQDRIGLQQLLFQLTLNRLEIV